MFFYDPVPLSCCSAFPIRPSGEMPRSKPLARWLDVSARSHRDILPLSTEELVLFVLGALELRAPFCFPRSLAASEAPVSPTEDGDGEGKDRVWTKSWGRAAVLQQSKGWHREVREGRCSLKWILGKMGIGLRIGGLEGLAGPRVACSGGMGTVSLCTWTRIPDSRELELCLGAEEDKSPPACEQT